MQDFERFYTLLLLAGFFLLLSLCTIQITLLHDCKTLFCKWFPFLLSSVSQTSPRGKVQCYSSVSQTSLGLCLLSLVSLKSLFLFSHHLPGGDFFPLLAGLCVFLRLVPL